MLRRTLLLVLLLAAAPAARGQAAVRTAAEAVLAARFPADVHRLNVRVTRTSEEVAALPAAAPLRVEFPAEAAAPRGRTQVDVLTGSDADGWRRAGWALLDVAHFDSVVVAARRVAGDEAVPEDALTVAWTETTSFRGTPLRPADLRALEAAGGPVAARLLRPGRPLRTSDLRPPWAADTGAAVELGYTRGGLALRLSTKAREPGAVGDVIRVYSPDTQATYRARLTAPGAATWIETL